MPQQQEPISGLNYGWDAGESGWKAGMDANLVKIGALLSPAVSAVAAAPTVTTNGTRYLVSASPSGDFAGQANSMAVRVAGTWRFYAPGAGAKVDNLATGKTLRFDGTAWAEVATGTPAQPFLDVSNPGGWTFTSAAWTKVPLYSLVTDTGAGWDAATNTDYAAPSDGLYQVNAVARPIRSGTGALPDNSAIALGVGPTAADSQDVVWGSGPATGVLFTLQCQSLVRLTAGQKVSVFSKHSHTAAVGFTYVKLQVVRISD